MELPHPEVRRGLVRAYAEVLERLELRASERPILLPSAEFFPDLFTGDEASVQRLLDRLLAHAGLSEMALEAHFWGEAETGCGTGACGSCGPSEPQPESERIERLVDAGECWRVNVLPAEVRQPVALTSSLCRAVALAVLREADSPPRLELDLAVDLSAVALGYGVLLLEGSHIYSKSCGGPSVARTTALGPSELSLLLALASATKGKPSAKLAKHLSATQRAAFAEASAWAESNGALVQTLARDPKRIAAGQFELQEPRSWLGRLIARKVAGQPSAESADTIEALEAALQSAPLPRASQKPRDPKLEEARRLVDEAFSE